MAKTLADVLTALAYRMGEDSSPSDAAESARRIRYINMGYFKIFTTQSFWFDKKSTTFNSVANQETYTTVGGFPSDYRDMIELRVDNKVYTYIPESEVTGLYDSTVQFFNYNQLVNARHWYVFGDAELHILPATPSAGTANISMKYHAWPTEVTSTSGTFLIPDMFTHMLDAYAFAQLSSIDSERGDKADAIAEFNDALTDLVVEDNRRKIWNKSVRTTNPGLLVS
jgi:hypothetical protein